MPAAVLLLLGAMTAVGPIALDLYLSAFPEIATELGVEAHQVQLTLTACMIGLGVGQLIAGIASDAYGRRRPLLIGMAVFLGFSLLCMASQDIWMLIIARFLQGAGGGAGIVIARSVIRDRTSGEAMVRALTTVMIVLGMAPILGPMIGGVLMELTGWRGVFGALSAIAALLALGSLTLKESLPPERRRPISIAKIRADFAAVLRDRDWQYGAGTVSLTSTAVFFYIGASAFVFQEVYGLSPLEYSIVFGVNAANFMIFSQSNRLLSRWFSAQTRLGVAVVGMCAASVVLATAALIDDAPIWLPMIGFALLPAAHGVGSPNGLAISLENHAERAGSASALQGVVQYTLAGVAVPLAGETLGGVAAAVCIVTVVLVLLRVSIGRRRAATVQPA
ncbi:MAG: multidrug effflux MFS transporter [Cumulibacter sp.]